MNNAPLTLTVSQLNECVKTIFDNAPYFGNLYVTGEITNFSNHYKTGHIYFTLKDEKSIIKAVMFQSYTHSLKFKPENNMMVTVHGRVSSFPRDGIYQIYVDAIEPLGAGALYIAFEQLKAKLASQGLFDEKHKKPIPKFPKKIAIITSPKGAAVEDLKSIIMRRYPICEIVIFPATVQGSNAPKELIAGLDYFENSDCDTVIIGRGGGSLEDLWCFNDEALAQKIYSCKKPIISAVGHETDFTICDFVSDLRAPTPSAAAELCVPDITELKIRLNSYSSNINSLVCGHLSKLKSELSKFSGLKFFCCPQYFFDEKKAFVGSLEQKISDSFDNKLVLYKNKLEKFDFDDVIKSHVKLKRMALEKACMAINIKSIMENKKNSLCLAAEKMTALNPMAVLSRGYSAVTDCNGKIITSAASLSNGDNIDITMADGKIGATVNKITKRSK